MTMIGPGENNYDEDAVEDVLDEGPEETEDPDAWGDEHRLNDDDL